VILCRRIAERYAVNSSAIGAPLCDCTPDHCSLRVGEDRNDGCCGGGCHTCEDDASPVSSSSAKIPLSRTFEEELTVAIDATSKVLSALEKLSHLVADGQGRRAIVEAPDRGRDPFAPSLSTLQSDVIG